MRKPAFCIYENKDADQLRGYREADQHLCFRYTDSTSVVPMIDYNRKSFIYMQPIINRLEFWESIIIGKIFKQKNFIFIEH